jgi:membrane protease subunit HflC
MSELSGPISQSKTKKRSLRGCRRSGNVRLNSIERREKAQKIRSEAEKDKEIILADAYKTAQELRGDGDAQAFKIYAGAYQQGPKFFEFMRTMEAYKKTLTKGTTLVTLTKGTTLVLSPDSEFLKYLKKR